MKKIIMASAIALVFTTSAFAASDIDVHESVNNSSAQAHQLMLKKIPEKQDAVTSTSQINQHEKAVTFHESTKNGSAPAHRNMAEQHKKMMSNGHKVKKPVVAESFNDMNEHQKAAVIHQSMNNGKSGAHQQMADDHLKEAEAN